jgi:hypothetical protein
VRTWAEEAHLSASIHTLSNFSRSDIFCSCLEFSGEVAAGGLTLASTGEGGGASEPVLGEVVGGSVESIEVELVSCSAPLVAVVPVLGVFSAVEVVVLVVVVAVVAVVTVVAVVLSEGDLGCSFATSGRNALNKISNCFDI